MEPYPIGGKESEENDASAFVDLLHDENNNRVIKARITFHQVKRKHPELDDDQENSHINDEIGEDKNKNKTNEKATVTTAMDLRSRCEHGCCLAGPGLTANKHVHRGHKRSRIATPSPSPPVTKR